MGRRGPGGPFFGVPRPAHPVRGVAPPADGQSLPRPVARLRRRHGERGRARGGGRGDQEQDGGQHGEARLHGVGSLCGRDRRPGRLPGTGRARHGRATVTRHFDLERTPMPTYVMLSTLSPEGVQTIKNNPSRIREVNKEIEQLGATVKAQWATLGHFDFVNIVEAPDEKTMARVSLELGSRGTAHYETLPAIPIDDFIASL